MSEGAKYGLELNWAKTFQIGICTPSSVSRPDGGVIEKKRDIVYLGGLISCDGRCARELSRRIGEGHSIFKILSRLWSHSGITLTRKVLLFNACVMSKVLYSLESVWLLKADKCDWMHSNVIVCAAFSVLHLLLYLASLMLMC